MAFGWLIILPLNLLLEPAETQVPDGVNDRPVILVNGMRLDAVVETEALRWRGGRYFGG